MTSDRGFLWYATRPSCRLLTHFAFFFGYLSLGGIIFMLLEGAEERNMVLRLRERRRRFLEHNRCVHDADLEEFIEEVVHAANRGVSAVKNVSQPEPNWSFGQALFFASTIVTTIGYGRVTPLSDAGKAFSIFFAILGIPLTLVLFSACVERLMIPTRHLLYWLYGKLGHLYKGWSDLQVAVSIFDFFVLSGTLGLFIHFWTSVFVLHIQVLHLAIILCIHVVFFMLIPAAIFAILEPGWNYLDAFYYCFISLSTIGLGDYIPGDSFDQPHRALYKVATTFYLLIGITMLLLVITVFYDIPELNLGYHFYLKSDEACRKAEDSEKTKLKSKELGTTNKYIKQVDDVQSIRSGQYHSYQQDITPVTEEEP